MSDDCVFIVEAGDTGKRLDAYIASEACDISRSAVQKLISEDNVTVNGKTARSSYRLKTGDVVVLSMPEMKAPDILPENIPLDIIYEDDDLLVINKQRGMVVHPAAGHYTGTMVNALLYHCGSSLSGINGVLRPGIVHRIDMDTSGVIVAAKTNEAHQCLAKQLAEHSMVREYKAFAAGGFAEDRLTVNKPIGRHPTDRKRMWVNPKNGKEAITHITVLQRFGGYTYVKAVLETGRTHQIRVHMAYIGHPLLGDKVYGHERTDIDGQALHAAKLGFVHPNGRYMEFETELPECMLAFL